MRNIILGILALAYFAAAHADQHEEQAIGELIDSFHAAAAAADKERYLGYMTDDAVFMGTDEWERWPKSPDFSDYVAGRFAGGTGWTYESVDRNIMLSDSSDIAWFDEVIFSESNGRFRGTGVVVKSDGEWKIAHYAMSFLIFNEDWPDVIELTRKTAEEKAAN
jgi:hypothetical protein